MPFVNTITGRITHVRQTIFSRYMKGRPKVLEGLVLPVALEPGTDVILREFCMDFDKPIGTIKNEVVDPKTGHRNYMVAFPGFGVHLVDEFKIVPAETTMGHRLAS